MHVPVGPHVTHERFMELVGPIREIYSKREAGIAWNGGDVLQIRFREGYPETLPVDYGQSDLDRLREKRPPLG